eukprot:gene2197-9465_t
MGDTVQFGKGSKWTKRIRFEDSRFGRLTYADWCHDPD